MKSEDSVEMKQTAPSHSSVVIPQDIQAVVAEIREPKRRQLVHTARQMFETRWAKYNDPHNLEWDFEEITDKWERHAWSAFLDLAAVEKERDTLLQIINSLTVTPKSSADWYHLDENCPGHYESESGQDCRAIADIASSITQDSASASELSTTVPDHGQASLPHVFEPHDSDEDDSNYCRLCDKYQFDQRFHVPESQRPETDSLGHVVINGGVGEQCRLCGADRERLNQPCAATPFAVQDSEQLKPCPFCGGSDLLLSDQLSEDREWNVFCHDCGGGSGWKQERKNAIVAWNTRIIPPVVEENQNDQS